MAEEPAQNGAPPEQTVLWAHRPVLLSPEQKKEILDRDEFERRALDALSDMINARLLGLNVPVHLLGLDDLGGNYSSAQTQR